jgi:hypothetical protein
MSTPVQAGNSGGPLLDQNGNLVGVVTAKLNALKFKRDFPQNVNCEDVDVPQHGGLQNSKCANRGEERTSRSS